MEFCTHITMKLKPIAVMRDQAMSYILIQIRMLLCLAIKL
ncbi:hypothetical protein L584_02820 [Pantoea agglomerans Tx10]|nr:hypothetical protein L584_02820 [Pantoea agglomerans Tx10]